MVWQAIAGLAGSLFNSGTSLFGAHQQYKNQSRLNKQTYQYNLKLQNHQNKFTQSMFDQSAKLAASAHQIETADLRSAGLNPILSATGGNGATLVSPMSGGSASMSGGSAQSVDAGKVDLMAAYNTAKQLKNDTKRVENETRNTDANIDLMRSQREVNSKQSSLYDSQKIQQDLNNNLTSLYGALQKEKELNLLDLNSAKVAQDIENSKLITASTLDVNKSLKEANSASAYYNRHRALGFSESYSESDSENKDYSPNIRNYKIGPISGTWADNDNTKNVYGRSRTRTRSRSY